MKCEMLGSCCSSAGVSFLLASAGACQSRDNKQLLRLFWISSRLEGWSSSSLRFLSRELRALVVEMVLATDMSCHFQQVKAMKNFLQQPEGWVAVPAQVDVAVRAHWEPLVNQQEELLRLHDICQLSCSDVVLTVMSGWSRCLQMSW